MPTGLEAAAGWNRKVEPYITAIRGIAVVDEGKVDEGKVDDAQSHNWAGERWLECYLADLKSSLFALFLPYFELSISTIAGLNDDTVRPKVQIIK